MITCKLEDLQEPAQKAAYLIPLHDTKNLVEIGEFVSFGRNSSNTVVLSDPFSSQNMRASKNAESNLYSRICAAVMEHGSTKTPFSKSY